MFTTVRNQYMFDDVGFRQCSENRPGRPVRPGNPWTSYFSGPDTHWPSNFFENRFISFNSADPVGGIVYDPARVNWFDPAFVTEKNLKRNSFWYVYESFSFSLDISQIWRYFHKETSKNQISSYYCYKSKKEKENNNRS